MRRSSRGAVTLPSASKRRTKVGPREVLLVLSLLIAGTYLAIVRSVLGRKCHENRTAREDQTAGGPRPPKKTKRLADDATKEVADDATVVLVLSRRDGFNRREDIRETWAKGQPHVYFIVGDRNCDVPHRFRMGARENRRTKLGCADEQGRQTAADMDGSLSLSEKEKGAWEEMIKRNQEIGTRLKQEMAKYGDILVASNVVDTYRSLPAKIKYGYRWATENLPHAKWFVKSDDDSLVRVAELSQYLNTDFREEVAAVDPLVNPAVVGHIVLWKRPNQRGKWKEFPEFQRQVYPPFPLGSYGHIVSRPVAQYVADNAKQLFEYQGEDVSLGIWLDESPLNGTTYFVDGTRFMNNEQDCWSSAHLVIGHDLDRDMMENCMDLSQQEGPRVIVGPGVVGTPRMGGRQRGRKFDPDDAMPRRERRKRGHFDPDDAMVDKLLGLDDKDKIKHRKGTRSQEKMRRMIQLENRQNRHNILPELASPDWNEDIAENAHKRQKDGLFFD